MGWKIKRWKRTVNTAGIADGVREGVEQGASILPQGVAATRLRLAIIASIEEVMGDPEEYDLHKVADDLIAKVRAYLIDEDAELPENPYRRGIGYADLHGAFFEGQQSVVDTGFRKVRERR